MSTPSLRRAASLCASDPRPQLLSALLGRDLQSFQELLALPGVDPDTWLGDPHHATLLELACGDPEGAQFVEALLAAGADPNRDNPARKTRPLHTAASAGHHAALVALLARPATQVNALDGLGNTALHLCAKTASSEECVASLLACPQCDVNITNRKGLTALHLAALRGSEALVRRMLQSASHSFDVDAAKPASGRTTRDLLIERFPSLEGLLPARVPTNREVNAAVLFRYLYHNDWSSFAETVQSMGDCLRREALAWSDGSCTLLQLACERGLTEAVKLLLELGADPHATAGFNPRPPAVLAAHHGHYHVLEWFVFYRVSRLTSSPDGQTPLHAAVLGARGQTPPGAGDDRDHEKCLRLLLSHVRDFGLDVNQQDARGNTALHYAAARDSQAVLSLLRSGAHIGVKNAFDEPPLANIDADTLEAFLGECLQTNGELPREENYEIIFKYSFLAPPNVSCDNNNATKEDVPHSSGRWFAETDPLLYISQSRDLKDLLKHPVITSFLYLKWLRMRCYYYTNLALYSSFVFLLTVYVLFVYSKPPSQDWFHRPIWLLLFMFYIWFVGRELFQLVVFLKKYLTSLENYLEIALIVVSGVILFSSFRDTEIIQPLSAVAILLSWAELVLLIGRHPKLSTNIEMLKRVTWNFLKFLAWYSLLILAFALSFYTLFRDCQTARTCEENFFAGPGTSVFKTVVMLTGEFDAASIPFVTFPVTSHVVFLLFVFLVAIVLFNLLNALAVCDTQAIRRDAELVGLVSRVRLVSHLEGVVSGDRLAWCCPNRLGIALFPGLVLPQQAGHRAVPRPGAAPTGWASRCSPAWCCPNRLGIALFPEALPEKAIRVLPNQNSRVVLSSRAHSCCRGCRQCGACRMDEQILRAAMDLLAGRRKPSLKDVWDLLGRSHSRMDSFQVQMSESSRRLQDYGPRFDRMDSSWKNTHEKMDLILEWLRTVNNNNYNRSETSAINSETIS